MYAIKCVIVGDYIEGLKGKILSRYLDDPSLLSGGDDRVNFINISDEPIYFHVGSIEGQEDYARLRPLSYASADVFIILYSNGSRRSEKNVTKTWYPELSSCLNKSKLMLVCIDEPEKNLEEFIDNGIELTEDEYVDRFLELVRRIKPDASLICSLSAPEDVYKIFSTAMNVVLKNEKKALSRQVRQYHDEQTEKLYHPYKTDRRLINAMILLAQAKRQEGNIFNCLPVELLFQIMTTLAEVSRSHRSLSNIKNTFNVVLRAISVTEEGNLIHAWKSTMDVCPGFFKQSRLKLRNVLEAQERIEAKEAQRVKRHRCCAVM